MKTSKRRWAWLKAMRYLGSGRIRVRGLGRDGCRSAASRPRCGAKQGSRQPTATVREPPASLSLYRVRMRGSQPLRRALPARTVSLKGGPRQGALHSTIWLLVGAHSPRQASKMPGDTCAYRVRGKPGTQHCTPEPLTEECKRPPIIAESQRATAQPKSRRLRPPFLDLCSAWALRLEHSGRYAP